MKTDNVEVELSADLTSYHPSLVKGCKGTIVSWTASVDFMARVRFREAGIMEINWRSLKIVDEEYLRQASERRKEEEEELLTATNVVLKLGPAGGFKYLSFVVRQKNGKTLNTGIGYEGRQLAKRYLDFFREHEIDVQEIRETKKK